MPWYKTGTVKTTNNSNAMIGTGTAFIANSRVGDAFRGPDGAWYEVTNIASDTAMSITPNYQGPTVAAGGYALAPMQGYVKDLADQARAIIQQWGATLAGLGSVSTENVVPVNKGGTGAADLVNARANLGLGPNANVSFGKTACSLLESSTVIGKLNPALYATVAGCYMGANAANTFEGNFLCNNGQLAVSGGGGFTWRTVNSSNTATGPSMQYTSTGTLHVPGAVNQNSDRRLKKNDVEILDGLEKILQVRPVEFDRRDDLVTDDYPHHEVGVIAQELNELLPILVTMNNPAIESDVCKVNYTGLIPYLISAVKQLKAELDELKTLMPQRETSEES